MSPRPDTALDGLVDAEHAARLHEAERRWLVSSRARLRHAATRRRLGGTSTGEAGAR